VAEEASRPRHGVADDEAEQRSREDVEREVDADVDA
jgi:hypothetical protein